MEEHPWTQITSHHALAIFTWVLFDQTVCTKYYKYCLQVPSDFCCHEEWRESHCNKQNQIENWKYKTSRESSQGTWKHRHLKRPGPPEVGPVSDGSARLFCLSLVQIWSSARALNWVKGPQRSIQNHHNKEDPCWILNTICLLCHHDPLLYIHDGWDFKTHFWDFLIEVPWARDSQSMRQIWHATNVYICPNMTGSPPLYQDALPFFSVVSSAMAKLTFCFSSLSRSSRNLTGVSIHNVSMSR